MTLKKGKNKITFIVVISCMIIFLFLLIYEFIAHNFNLQGFMGNSVTSKFYYCEDSSYTLDGNKCYKTNTIASSILGDVNSDGKVDSSDSETLKQYLAKTIILTDEQLIAADVNSDGIVNVGDAENIRLYSTGHILSNDYNNIGTLSVCPKGYDISNGMCIKKIEVNAKEANYQKGDINLDGFVDLQDIKLLNKYLKKQVNLTTIQLNVADYNNNGFIDINDLNELKQYLNNTDSSNDVVGDINLDGTVNSNDVIFLNKYINKEIKLTNKQLLYSDIDENGKVDVNDVKMLAKKISDFYQIGDINMDGTVNNADLTLLQNAANLVIDLNLVELNLCDIDGNGTFDNNDIITLRSKVSRGKKYKKGDTNMDGDIKDDDVVIIENYILGKTVLTIDQMTLADYNQDGVIDNSDANNLAKAISSNYNLGDINMDGKINMLDIRLLNEYLSNIKQLNTVQKLLADVNEDGKISTDDLLKK